MFKYFWLLCAHTNQYFSILFNNIFSMFVNQNCRGIYSYQKFISSQPIKIEGLIYSFLHREARVVRGGAPTAGGSAPRAKFFEDRLGYPAISMNFKTESFTYVILLIFTHFVISLTFNFLMIG